MEATAGIVLDTRRIKADGTYPLKLRVTHKRKRKYYGIGVDLSNEEWNKVQDPETRVKGKLQEVRIKKVSVLERANTIIKDLKGFSFNLFEKAFFSGTGSRLDLISAFENYIQKCDTEERAGTASSYRCAMNSLKSFRAGLTFLDVTVDFLKAYERWMIKNGNSITTVGIYLRCVRTLFNEAIEEGQVKSEVYPFGKRRYQIPTGRNIKKALTLSDVEKIYNYETIPGSTEDKAKDLWMFSYLCNGMNIKDICRLKHKNITKDILSYVRAKTEKTKRETKHITVILSEDALRIIKKWNSYPQNPDSYIFPVLKPGIDPKKELLIVNQLVKTINKYIRRIAAQVGIEKDITTYTARHTFSTVLKRSGASTEFISEALGHTDLKTTENYLDSFEENIKREYTALLTNFKKKK